MRVSRTLDSFTDEVTTLIPIATHTHTHTHKAYTLNLQQNCRLELEYIYTNVYNVVQFSMAALHIVYFT